jgi:dolichol kinase
MRNMGKSNNIKQKLVNGQLEIKKKIDSIEFDAHWFRRVFHTFGAFFLIYYLLPDEKWINILKISISIVLVISVAALDYIRIKGRIDSSNFFGLRIYEKNRPASYLYFGLALIILLLFFPQQIAIPCILCACFSDPIIGEIRYRLGKNKAIIIGFFVCMFFFLVTWFKTDLWILLLVSIAGASAAVVGEAKQFWFIDDDFMIQMLPAIIMLLLWQGLLLLGIDILPAKIILPI